MMPLSYVYVLPQEEPQSSIGRHIPGSEYAIRITHKLILYGSHEERGPSEKCKCKIQACLEQRTGQFPRLCTTAYSRLPGGSFQMGLDVNAFSTLKDAQYLCGLFGFTDRKWYSHDYANRRVRSCVSPNIKLSGRVAFATVASIYFRPEHFQSPKCNIALPMLLPPIIRDSPDAGPAVPTDRSYSSKRWNYSMTGFNHYWRSTVA